MAIIGVIGEGSKGMYSTDIILKDLHFELASSLTCLFSASILWVLLLLIEDFSSHGINDVIHLPVTEETMNQVLLKWAGHKSCEGTKEA